MLPISLSPSSQTHHTRVLGTLEVKKQEKNILSSREKEEKKKKNRRERERERERKEKKEEK